MGLFKYFYTLPGEEEKTDGKNYTLIEVAQKDEEIKKENGKPGFKSRIERID